MCSQHLWRALIRFVAYDPVTHVYTLYIGGSEIDPVYLLDAYVPIAVRNLYANGQIRFHAKVNLAQVDRNHLVIQDWELK
jgi:hypothetical protein